MAKEKNQPQAPAEKQPPVLPQIGEVVWYFRHQNSGNGAVKQTFAAIVQGYPPKTSNYQAKDLAVKLAVFSDQGEQRREAMFDSTGEQKDGRWGYRE